MSESVLKFRCMDPRQRADLDRGEALRVSRAGGFVGGLSDYWPYLLREREIHKVDIGTHDQCGAMKVVSIGIRNPKEVHPSIYSTIIEPFSFFLSGNTNPTFELKYLEDIAVEMQRRIALKWMRDEDISCTKKITSGIVEDKRVLLLTTPTTRKLAEVVESVGLKSSNTYVITLVPGRLDQMMIDPLLAVTHIKGIEKVAIHAGKEEGHVAIDRFYEALRSGRVKLRDANVVRLD